MNNSSQIPQSDFLSVPKQAKRLEERHTAAQMHVHCGALDIVVDPGVYQTSTDTKLMMESVDIGQTENFLEIGCGSGVVSIAVAKRAASGLGVDINALAVANSVRNAQLQGVSNVEFLLSNGFEQVAGVFDVIICNPPYTRHDVQDTIDRMFWDPNDEMKERFFKEASAHLKLNGRIYFGWANFGDIDVDLPFRLAAENGFRLENTFSEAHNSDVTFYVLEFQRLHQ